MKLIKNVELYAPEPLGVKDVLFIENRILKIADAIDVSGLDVEVFDRSGHIMTPGLIDNHVHLTGGGGEAGYASRVPEIMLSDFIRAGITSAVGLLGTDGHTRTMRDLIAKVKALRQEGMSAYALSGSYQVPVNTLMDSIEDDMLFIEEIIGVGEIAISDHRSSIPSVETIRNILAKVHVGGLLSGKGGVLNLHVGSGKEGLKPLKQALNTSDLPASKVVPTHINRSDALLREGIGYSIEHDAPIDLTAYSNKDDALAAYRVLGNVLAKGVSIENVMLSSDGQGSLPVFDSSGRFKRMGIGSVKALHENLVKAVKTVGIPFEDALGTVTKNVANFYNLKGKGRVKEGYDADLLILDQDFGITDVFMGGNPMMIKGGIIRTGTFE